jgi:hypothetical protein
MARPKGRPKGCLNKPKPDDPTSDLVWGAKAIAPVINRTPFDVYRLHAEGRLPTHSVASLIVGERTKLKNPATWPKQKVGEYIG